MGFIDDLNKLRQKRLPIPPLNSENITEDTKTTSTNPVDAANVLSAENTGTNKVINTAVEKPNVDGTPVNNPVVAVNNPDIFKNKPESLSNNDWERLLRYFPEDKILRHYDKPFEPDGSDGLFTRIFKENIEKPKELDEKKIGNAQLMGSLSDAASMIIQMLSANGDGAHIRNRDYNQSATAALNKDEKDLRRLYQLKRDKYKSDLFDVNMKDILHSYNEHNAMQKNINNILLQGDKADRDKEKFNLQMLFNQQKDDRNHQFKMLQEQNREKDRKARLGIQYGNLEQNKRRTEAYIKRTGTGSNAGYEMRIDATDNDGQAIKDEFGNPVRVIQLTKGQVDQYAQKALSNPLFLERHPELISKNDLTGKLDHETKDRLARAYIQDWYDGETGKERLSGLMDTLSGVGSKFINRLGTLGNLFGDGSGGNQEQTDEYDTEEFYYNDFED